MDLKQQAVTKAIALLKAAGAEYTVTFEGDTQSNVTEKPKLPNKRPHFLEIHKAFVDGLTSPCSARFEVPDGQDVGKVRGSMLNYLLLKFGKGNVMTTINRKTGSIDVLVV